MIKQLTLATSMALAMAASAAVLAHGGEVHGSKPIDYAKAEEKAFGRAADPAKATRTITIDMRDTMRFNPAALSIRQGEIVKFVIKNRGRLMHELVLGTERELKEHGELMKRFPEMEHDEPYMAHVAPGKSGVIGWQFTQAGDFRFVCLLPGHYEAGMVGTIRVLPAK
jgi:uncharacterized cupredoxin-like copper-binding protein